MSSLCLVLDANIIIRAVLGNKVRNYLIYNNEHVDFFTPDVCIEDAEKYLPIIFEKRNLPTAMSLEVLSQIKNFLRIIDYDIYQDRMIEAQQRMNKKDLDDWPVVATALSFNCPIWTEDRDFFGVGLPTWTTDRIHIFFKNPEKQDYRLPTKESLT